MVGWQDGKRIDSEKGGWVGGRRSVSCLEVSLLAETVVRRAWHLALLQLSQALKYDLL